MHAHKSFLAGLTTLLVRRLRRLLCDSFLPWLDSPVSQFHSSPAILSPYSFIFLFLYTNKVMCVSSSWLQFAYVLVCHLCRLTCCGFHWAEPFLKLNWQDELQEREEFPPSSSGATSSSRKTSAYLSSAVTLCCFTQWCFLLIIQASTLDGVHVLFKASCSINMTLCWR